MPRISLEKIAEDMGFVVETPTFSLEGYLSLIPPEILRIIEHYSRYAYEDNFETALKDHNDKYLFLVIEPHNNSRMAMICKATDERFGNDKLDSDFIYYARAIILTQMERNIALSMRRPYDDELYISVSSITSRSIMLMHHGCELKYLSVLTVKPPKTSLGIFMQDYVIRKIDYNNE